MTNNQTKTDPGVDPQHGYIDYRAYADANLSVFPVHVVVDGKGGKIAPPTGHQKYANNVPSKSEIEAWTQPGHSAQAFGMAMGKTFDADHRIVCLDIDDPGLVRAIQYLYPTPCARFGSKGVGLFYKVDRNDKDMKKSVNMMIPGVNSPAVEYLSVGRFTFVPPSIHRKTGNPYQWVGEPLLNVLSKLPLFTYKDLRVIQTIVNLDVDGATIKNVTAGEGTHYATLSLCGALVARGLDRDRVVEAVTLLFPDDYQGDTTKQIPEMVDSAFKKGFDKKQVKLTDTDATDEDFSNIFTDWHYVKNIDRMFNTTTLESLDEKRFKSVMGKVAKNAWALYMQWQDNSIKSSLTYLPGKPAIIDDMLNVWRPTELNPKRGDVQIWLDHISHFYSEEDVDHILNWLAHALQKPSVKPGHAILLGSKFEGIGKDLWLIPVRAAFGKNNVSEIGADSLSSQFNEWLAHKHLIILQEIWTGSRRELSNQLKPLLSSPPDEIMVNEKNVSRYAIPNICATIMLTNHKDAISMAAEDRRYFVMWSDAPPKDSDYYSLFSSWVANSENQGYVYDYLLKRDISRFNINARPPKTAAKVAMIETTMTKAENLVEVVKDYLDDRGIGDVVSMPPIFNDLREVYPDNARDISRIGTSKAHYPIKLALEQMGYERYPKKVARRVHGVVKRLVIFIKTEKMERYSKMPDSDLYALAVTPFGHEGGKTDEQIINDANDQAEF